MTGIETSKAWTDLVAVDRPRSIAGLFATDPGRVEKLTLSIGDLVIDLSKNLIDDQESIFYSMAKDSNLI